MFTLFLQLPAEIRLQIWRKAIQAPAVWFTVMREHNHQDPPLQRRDLTLVPVGPAPYLAGLTCRESRHEMETVMTNPMRMSDDGTDPRVFWIDWNHTVLHVGQDHRASNVLMLLDPHEAALVKHVAIENDRLNILFFGAIYVARLCPQVRTVIIHDRRDYQVDFTNPFLPQLTPSAKTALLYEARSVMNPTYPEINHGRDEGSRSYLQQKFREQGWTTNFPRMHFLGFSEDEY